MVSNKTNSTKRNLDILVEVIDAASNSLELNDILSRVVQIISKLTKADSCFIYLIKDSELVLKASLNSHPKSLSSITMHVGEGITGWVAETKKAVAIGKHAYKDKRFKAFAALPEDLFESFLSVPIVFRNKVIGVINVQHKASRRYGKADVDLLETIGRQIGGILEVSRLLSETNALQEALAAQKIISRAKAILVKNGMTEEAAHKLLLKKSMDKRKSVKEVAEAIVLASEVGGI
jgi:uroporphyrinogen-III synthase